ncbi:MAG TPA: ABC transporter permease [Vicinamibacterales bacterium]|nr:ABC transporter permease [Vicinamibacterales bacterium]
MTPRALVLRNLRHYWRTNLAVIAGVATAVAVLAGALLVGDSVRGSLRDLVLQRLGRTDRVVVSTGFFREALAADLQKDPAFRGPFAGTVPLLVMQGLVTDQASGRRTSKVQVYGIDDRFWRFHNLQRRTGPANRDALLSRALATDIGAADGGTILLRLERPSAIPIESLHGQKEDPGRTLRLTMRGIVSAADLGDFSIRPQQGDVRAIFVPLRRLQQDLDLTGKVNALLVSDQPGALADDPTSLLQMILKKNARLEDHGLSLRLLDHDRGIALEADAGVIDAARATAVSQAAKLADVGERPVFTYLANTLRSGTREVPYSLVSATFIPSIVPPMMLDQSGVPARPPIVLNDWTARELGVNVGDPLTLEYYVWRDPGYLETQHADFAVGAIVPIDGAAGDRDLAPVYPGITEADTLGDWDPPFPIDLKRVRPQDEDYWKKYRTTPKAFMFFEVGRDLWRTRYGDRTSVRLIPAAGQTLEAARDRFTSAFLAAADPASIGLVARAVRADAMTSSRGSTDFGEYFVYFSFFLVASALVLAALFFRLGVEQRAREVGLLRAVGFSTPGVRRLFTAEALLLAAIGSAIGIGGAVLYGAIMMAGLRSWWSGAVGTTALTLHVSPISLFAGAIGALLAAIGCIWWTLRGLSRLSERALLAGSIQEERVEHAGLPRRSALGAKAGVVAFAAIGLGLIGAARAHAIDPAGAFFGAGASILIACLCLVTWRLRAHSAGGTPSIVRLGFRNTTERPGRSVLAIAVIASATFILISVDAFRRGAIDPSDRHSGTGGYPLLVDLLLPLVHDPDSRDARELLGLQEAGGVSVEAFRVLPGEDASCLNLYEPVNPRILGVSQRLIDSGRFVFQGSLASTDADRANPWRLLAQQGTDGVIPVAADANSMTYVLHKKLADEIPLTHGAQHIRLRLVAALADSVFQGELLMSDANFVKLFPEQQGYRLLLIDAPLAQAATIAQTIERTAGDLGADAIPTSQRLAEFHAVENTFISTFQSLGGLGLLVGTVGLAAVLLRNVLERRREIALLRAVGYARGNLFAIVLAENAVLLGLGLAVGAISALIAIAPAALERGARIPISAAGWLLLLAVLGAGLLSSGIATRAALRESLLAALRSE